MLPQWTQPNNTVLQEIQERVRVTIDLPLASTDGVTTSIISGELPAGLRLLDNQIIGTATEVERRTSKQFVVRASTIDGISDRTFKLIVEGRDAPEWQTLEGRLPVGPNQVYFILDNSLIDFQLLATDSDVSAGVEGALEYFIADGDGELPPGIELTQDGRIIGQAEPLPSFEWNVIENGYDSNDFAKYPYDWAAPDATRNYRTLNRIYPFIVTVADKVSFVKREFSIYVVSEEYVRADNTLMKAADGVFTADTTYLRSPLWITDSDLGTKRANNYITIYLDTLDQNNTEGKITYALEGVNDDGSESILPPGVVLDEETGELAGIVPYQPAITIDYKFTITAIRTDVDDGIVTVFGTFIQDVLSGETTIRLAKLPRTLTDGLDDLQSLVNKEVAIEGKYYTIISVDDSNTEYDTIELNEGIRAFPEYNSINVIETAFSGQNFAWISPIDNNDKDFYIGKSLNFSDTAQYQIEDVIDYVNWKITPDDSAATLGLTELAGWTGSIESTLEAYFSTSSAPATVTVTRISGRPVEINMHIVSTAANRNKSTVLALFETDDSSGRSGEIVSSDQRLVLDGNLAATLFAGRDISLGGVVGTFFKKSLPRDETEVVEKSRTFTLRLQGEVDSVVTWISPSDLGTIATNRISELRLEASTTLEDSVLLYSLVDGSLPPGLTLKNNGEIIGKVPLFGTAEQPGMTFFDSDNTTFDGDTTTCDRVFTFTVQAKDRYKYSAINRTFTIRIDDTDRLNYSNIYVQPFLKPAEKQNYLTLVNDSGVVPPESVYRPFDSNFGIQRKLRSLVFAGIETQEVSQFARITAKNHKRKQYYFGELKTAVAKTEGTDDVVYEVVYIELVDPARPKVENQRTATSFRTLTNTNKITMDSIKLEGNDDAFIGREGQIGITITGADGTVYIFETVASSATVILRDGTVVPVYNDNSVIVITLQDGSLANIVVNIDPGAEGVGAVWRYRPKGNTITADNDAIQVDQTSDSKKYISNIDNMRDSIKNMTLNDGSTQASFSRDFLPLWMRTPQEGRLDDLDYVFAVPIVYTLPGFGETVRQNIINSNFNFNTINYDIDRYIIDATTGDSNEQYILFQNFSYNV